VGVILSSLLISLPVSAGTNTAAVSVSVKPVTQTLSCQMRQDGQFAPGKCTVNFSSALTAGTKVKIVFQRSSGDSFDVGSFEIGKASQSSFPYSYGCYDYQDQVTTCNGKYSYKYDGVSTIRSTASVNTYANRTVPFVNSLSHVVINTGSTSATFIQPNLYMDDDIWYTSGGEVFVTVTY